MSRAVFIDRDGVINEMVPSLEGPDSPRSTAEFRLLPGAAKAIRMLNQIALPAVLASNQPGVAKGKVPAANHEAMTAQMTAELAAEGAVLDGIYYCMHHPQAVLADYRQVCDCRKPKPGLLIQAAEDMALVLTGSYMIGDHPRDIVAGKAVGCTGILVTSGVSGDSIHDADHVCRDLLAAVRLIAQLETAAVASQ